jgi:hypothetical protein
MTAAFVHRDEEDSNFKTASVAPNIVIASAAKQSMRLQRSKSGGLLRGARNDAEM